MDFGRSRARSSSASGSRSDAPAATLGHVHSAALPCLSSHQVIALNNKDLDVLLFIIIYIFRRNYSNEPLLVICMFMSHSGTKTDPTILLLPMTVKCTLCHGFHNMKSTIRYVI